MTQAMDWQGDVGRTWAESYTLTDRAFGGLTQHLLEQIDRLGGSAVLDIGCGAGELSLAIARQRPQARVVGVDISEALVAAAAERAGSRAQVSFAVADAGNWQSANFRPDLLVSRHGVMFFADPPAAFAHLHDLAASDAHLVFSCFRDRSLNPWASGIGALLPPELVVAPADPREPGPFAFADPAYVEGILAAGGWRNIAFEPFDFAYVAGVGERAVAEACAFFNRIGPAASALSAIRGTPAEAGFQARLAAWVEHNASAGLVAFPAATWIVTARRG